MATVLDVPASRAVAAGGEVVARPSPPAGAGPAPAQVPPAGVPTGPWRTGILETVADLHALESGWRQLCDQAGGAVEQFDWIVASAETLGGSTPLRFEVQYQGDRLVAAAPFVLRRIRGVRRRAQLGMAELFEPMSLLAADVESLARLVDQIARDRWPLVCGRLPVDHPSTAALRAACERTGFVVVRPELAAPRITLDESWTTPENHLNSGRRSDFRRARRRAEELGHVEIAISTPTPAELQPLLDEALSVESASWKGAVGTALATDAVGGALFRRLADSACRRGELRIALLRINGRAVAMQIALVQCRKFWLLKVGYHPEFARCSPGLLLVRETIALAAREGLQAYEFLGREEPWISLWTSERHECVSLRSYPRSLPGLAALAVDGGLYVGRAMWHGVRSVRRRLVEAVKRPVRAVIARAAHNYIAGDTLSDAERVRTELAAKSLGATIGYWDAVDEEPGAVAEQYLAGIDLLASSPGGDYLSIKLPSLGPDDKRILAVAARAAEAGCRLHFDALAPEHASRTMQTIERLRVKHPRLSLSHTLPGRWVRSVADADWVAIQQIPVRVVKGQWVDPAAPERDLRQGYLEVIERLAGKAAFVSVATHDAVLAAAALERLQATDTPCNVELLYGLPMRDSLRLAARMNVPVRIYIPYGAAYLPYATARLRKDPRIACWLLKDALAAALRRK